MQWLPSGICEYYKLFPFKPGSHFLLWPHSLFCTISNIHILRMLYPSTWSWKDGTGVLKCPMKEETGTARQSSVILKWSLHGARDEKRFSLNDFVFILNLTMVEAASWVFSNVSWKFTLLFNPVWVGSVANCTTNKPTWGSAECDGSYIIQLAKQKLGGSH